MEINDMEVTDLALPSSVVVENSETTPMNQQEKDSSLYWQIGQKLGTCMLHLYTSNLWTDVTFRCKDHVENYKADRIRAHKIVLAARSPFFQGMFYGPCAEIREGEVDLLTTESGIFDLVLRYMYSDETRLSEDTAPRVLELAHIYQIPSLVEYCADFLASVLRSDNACEILELALVYNQNKLRDDACVFIDNHAKQVFDSDGFLRISNACLTYILKGDTLFENEGYIFKRAMDWAESKLSGTGETVDRQNKRNILGKAFYCLRVPTLGRSEFWSCTEGENFYSMQEIENILEHINGKSFNARLCHSIVTRGPQELEVRVLSVDQLIAKPTDFYNCRRLEHDCVEEINCMILVSISRDCFLRSIALHDMFPVFLHYIKIDMEETEFVTDELADVTLDCVLYIDEIQFKTEFQMKKDDRNPIILEKPVPLEKKDTPYSVKVNMKYRSEYSLIRLYARINSKYGDHCEGNGHTESCLLMLRKSPNVNGVSASYCDSSEHVDCIDNLGVHFLSCRVNDNAVI